jgi:ubiquinone/menaquinone biosynthesis C-methylase UbiE
MLSRAAARDGRRRIAFALGEAQALPFADAAFDVLTVSFATRNLNLSTEALEAAFREFHRVLRPGGTFVNVETSRPPNPLVRAVFRLYVRLLVRPLGRLVAGQAGRAGYAYLATTIPRFHAAGDLASILSRAGFREVSFRRLLLGAAAIHASVR